MDPILTLLPRLGVDAVISGPLASPGYDPDAAANYTPGSASPAAGTPVRGLWEQPDQGSADWTARLVVPQSQMPDGVVPHVHRVDCQGVNYEIHEILPRFWGGQRNGSELRLIG